MEHRILAFTSTWTRTLCRCAAHTRERCRPGRRRVRFHRLMGCCLFKSLDFAARRGQRQFWAHIMGLHVVCFKCMCASVYTSFTVFTNGAVCSLMSINEFTCPVRHLKTLKALQTKCKTIVGNLFWSMYSESVTQANCTLKRKSWFLKLYSTISFKAVFTSHEHATTMWV